MCCDNDVITNKDLAYGVEVVFFQLIFLKCHAKLTQMVASNSTKICSQSANQSLFMNDQIKRLFIFAHL